ncbi:protein adenylyltransferase SelO [Ramlibacter rhizophilus]|uniref:Protein nucleotidyltransferase YdiU n=1 Tax=Ramlibacter rhizophilus TaxID=1781167 RepID=A0A4Z0C3X2_9BURK|nr:YdiU family protein [Ramlibacter rhizophilus]TFZ04899.1 YdiU family protein [Ramlibacter rhizophilus]
MNALLERPGLDLGLAWRADGIAALGPAFHTRLMPTPLPSPYLVGLSEALARELGLSPQELGTPEALDAFTGNRLLAGSDPLATVYSGHQFGVWAGQLGDGRAILLGEADTPAGPRELQLKGSGRTPYSRMGDGRAVLRSSIREFLASEAMAGLGVPTTRALMVTGSDAPVRREEIETAAVVTRVAPSFIRFGHFEHFAAANRLDELRRLADFVIDRFHPACREAPQPYAALLQAVTERTADLVAQWQALGFCHGVMNTDNMSILGLTIDYGPFQFLDAFDPGHVCNHSDTEGRYAYNRQPNVAYWNLFCLGQALLPLIGEQEPALAALEAYKSAFPHALQTRMSAKLGLQDAREGDRALIEDLLGLMAAARMDYTLFWRRLSRHAAGDALDPVRDLFIDRDAFDAWLARWRERVAQEPDAAGAGVRMLATNPKYVLRNHLGELAIRQARNQDFSGVARLLAVLQSPFDEHSAHEAEFAGLPPDWASSIEISCSS